MSTVARELSDDIAALKAMVLASRAELHGRDLMIEKLKHQLAGHQRHRFGSRSESADQLNLQLQLEEEETAAARTARPEDTTETELKQEPKRKPLPPELP